MRLRETAKILFNKIMGSTGAIVIRGNETSVGVKRIRPRPKPPTKLQLSWRTPYSRADCIWRWLGDTRRMQWRKGPHRSDVSGYEQFMSVNIRCFHYYNLPDLQPPNARAWKPPSLRTYITTPQAIWPAICHPSHLILSRRSSLGSGANPSKAIALAQALANLNANFHDDPLVTYPVLTSFTRQTHTMWYFDLACAQLLIAYALPFTPDGIAPSHITTGWLDLNPVSNLPGNPPQWPVLINNEPHLLAPAPILLHPKLHPSLSDPWIYLTPDPSIPGWITPDMLYDAMATWNSDTRCETASLENTNAFTHWTTHTPAPQPPYEIIYRNAPCFYPSTPFDKDWISGIAQPIPVRYTPKP